MRFLNPFVLLPGILIAGAILLIHLLSRGKAKRKKFPPVSFLIKLSKRKLTFIKIKDIVALIIRTLIPLFLFAALAKPVVITRFPYGKNYIFVVDQSRRFLENIEQKDIIKGKRFLILDEDGNFSIENKFPQDTIDFVYPVDKAFLYLDSIGSKGVFFTDIHEKTLKRLVKIKKSLTNIPWIVPIKTKNKKRFFIKKITMNLSPSLKNASIKINLYSIDNRKVSINLKGSINYSNKFSLKKECLRAKKIKLTDKEYQQLLSWITSIKKQ